MTTSAHANTTQLQSFMKENCTKKEMQTAQDSKYPFWKARDCEDYGQKASELNERVELGVTTINFP